MMTNNRRTLIPKMDFTSHLNSQLIFRDNQNNISINSKSRTINVDWVIFAALVKTMHTAYDLLINTYHKFPVHVYYFRYTYATYLIQAQQYELLPTVPLSIHIHQLKHRTTPILVQLPDPRQSIPIGNHFNTSFCCL